jgi:hypothetical protein
MILCTVVHCSGMKYNYTNTIVKLGILNGQNKPLTGRYHRQVRKDTKSANTEIPGT